MGKIDFPKYHFFNPGGIGLVINSLKAETVAIVKGIGSLGIPIFPWLIPLTNLA